VYVILAVVAVVVGVIVWGSIVKNKWGINFGRVDCPNCGLTQSRVRAPDSTSQTVWGGQTCPRCHCVMDKWGRGKPTS